MRNQKLAQISVCLIGGPTASGKSALALEIARDKNAVIINADSMQVYQELPILTAQPNSHEKAEIPHYLYGFLPGDKTCSVALWQRHALQTIQDVHNQGKTPIVVGGTGLYLNALLQGISTIPDISTKVRSHVRQLAAEKQGDSLFKTLCEIDPIMGQRLNPGDTQRVQRAIEVKLATGKSLAQWQDQRDTQAIAHLSCQLYILSPPRTFLQQRCKSRLKQMVEQGALDEVNALSQQGYDPALPIMKALGFRELSRYCQGKMDLDDALEAAFIATRQYVKRQSTWFRNQFPDATVIPYPDSLQEVMGELCSL